MFRRLMMFSALLCAVFSSYVVNSQTLKRVEPMFWWKGMTNPEVQLLVYGDKIASAKVSVSYEGVELKKVNKVENENYLFLDLVVSKRAKAGTFPIKFTKAGKTVAEYSFELKERRKNSAERESFSSADVMYLIMPDRFANGDPSNDSLKGMKEKANREDSNGRHGGDLIGIQNKLDYLSDLGVTAIWLNPVLENNMTSFSYHGYATTDFYSVDRRFGGNDAYIKLTEEAHKKDIKVVMDMIFNHCGSEHWWMDDLPSKDWLNQWSEFTQTNYRGTTVADPYASKHDRNQMVNGWFVKTMPDLNQNNPFVSKYLIQNSIWWIEYADIDGIRMDTHPYADKFMMAEWAKAIRVEYPKFMIVGEVWLDDPAALAYWGKNAKNFDGFNSHLPGLIDFPFMFAVKRSLNEKNGWWEGAAGFYYLLSKDYHYEDPNTNLTFLDNHDLSRIWSELGKDMKKFKMGFTFLFTTRGIPMIYYATEVLSDGFEHEGHGFIRKDFVGGWKGDQRDAFSEKGRTKQENEAFAHMQKLMNWRKGKNVIHKGKLTHWLPVNNVYAYVRHNEKEKVLVLLNNDEKEQKFEAKRYQELLAGHAEAYEVLTGKDVKLEKLKIPAKTSMILELK